MSSRWLAEELPFPDRRFDPVVGKAILHLTERPTEPARQRPGGRAAFPSRWARTCCSSSSNHVPIRPGTSARGSAADQPDVKAWAVGFEEFHITRSSC